MNTPPALASPGTFPHASTARCVLHTYLLTQRIGYPAYFSDDGYRRSAVVDKELFAVAVLLAHGDTARFFLLPVAAAEMGVPHSQLTSLSLVLHP